MSIRDEKEFREIAKKITLLSPLRGGPIGFIWNSHMQVVASVLYKALKEDVTEGDVIGELRRKFGPGSGVINGDYFIGGIETTFEGYDNIRKLKHNEIYPASYNATDLKNVLEKFNRYYNPDWKPFQIYDKMAYLKAEGESFSECIGEYLLKMYGWKGIYGPLFCESFLVLPTCKNNGKSNFYVQKIDVDMIGKENIQEQYDKLIEEKV